MAHDIKNYQIGKGIPYFQLNGSGAFVDMGNPVEFEFTPEVETLEHNSNREGVKVVDRKVITSKKASLRIVLDEITMENLALAVLGTVTGDVIEIFDKSSISGAFRFVGTNDIGSKYTWEFPRVEFLPDGSVTGLSEEFNQIELTAQITPVAGSFGTITKTADEGDSESESESES